jgi:hypothetical protein
MQGRTAISFCADLKVSADGVLGHLETNGERRAARTAGDDNHAGRAGIRSRRSGKIVHK